MDETTTEEDRLYLLEHMARELFVHKDITAKQAFDMAHEFVDLQYDTDYSKIRTMKQPIYVRYIVENHDRGHHNSRIELHIACTDVKGFNVINIKRYEGAASDIPSFVEAEARQQLDKLLKEDGRRAGFINIREVNSFMGNF